jgi:hypothetical protein
VKWSGKQTVGGSLEYLVAHRTQLTAYEYPEDLGVAAYDEENPDPAARALAVNLEAVRNAMLEGLWRREIFLGPEVVDQLLFYAAKGADETDPLMAALEFLRDRRVTRPGMILFPLHSLGILRAGLLRGDTKERAQFIDAAQGVAVTPQTNALCQTIEFVERVRRAFDVRKPADPELVRHWFRSRPTEWLERNPLIAIRMTTQRGSFFDTEVVVVSRVRAATARLAMISTFQAGDPDRPSSLFSTSRINNWETLDIHHYIVFSDNPGRGGTLDGDCVPLHRRSNIVELSDLSIEIDPAFRGRKATIARINEAVAAAYQGHLDHMWRRRRNARTRTYDRLFASLAFFVRSFHNEGQSWSAAVSLATAFEMVLTDHYSGGATRRLERRVGPRAPRHPRAR